MTAIAQSTPTGRSSTLRRLPTWPLLTPALMVMTLLCLFPIARLVVISFQEGVGFGIYLEILSSSLYQGILWRTVRLSVLTTLICLVIAVPVALKVRTLPASARGYLNLAFLSPLLINSVVRALGWVALLGPSSELQGFVDSLGIDVSLIYSDVGVVIGLVDIFLGYMVVALETGLLALDPRLEDAARNLGAGEIRVLGRIVLPQVLPSIVTGMTLVWVLSASSYVTPTLLGGTSSQMAAPFVFTLSVVQLDNEHASALAVILVVLIAIIAGMVSYFGLRPLQRWRTVAAVSPDRAAQAAKRRPRSVVQETAATMTGDEHNG